MEIFTLLLLPFSSIGTLLFVFWFIDKVEKIKRHREEVPIWVTKFNDEEIHHGPKGPTIWYIDDNDGK